MLTTNQFPLRMKSRDIGGILFHVRLCLNLELIIMDCKPKRKLYAQSAFAPTLQKGFRRCRTVEK